MRPVSVFIILAGLGVVAGLVGQQFFKWDMIRQERFLFEVMRQQTEGPQFRQINRAEQGEPAQSLLTALEDNALHPEAMAIENSDGISVEKVPFQKRESGSEEFFTRFQGDQFGFNETGNFSALKLIEPFMYFRGIAAGDVHNDGWIDIVVTSDSGLALYANQRGERYRQQQINIPKLDAYYVVNAALVDLNDDGWLDLFFSTHDHGTYVIYNQEGQFSEEDLYPIPNQDDAAMSASAAFSDVERDGDLDIFLGNWTVGAYNFNGLRSARNVLLENERGEFQIKPVPGIEGQTLSTLFTDFNNDSYLDLLVGNDFEPTDNYYFGNGQGDFRPIIRDEGIIPHSTNWTMSLATADINNDLVPEIYSAHLSRDHHVTILSASEICAEIIDGAEKQQCEEMIELRDRALRARRTNNVLTCLSIEDEAYREGCIGFYFVAARNKTQ